MEGEGKYPNAPPQCMLCFLVGDVDGGEGGWEIVHEGWFRITAIAYSKVT